jgi:hypothetical protein
MKLNKTQLDRYSTLFGLIAAIATVLTTQEVIPKKWGGSISGVAIALVGYLTQRPADSSPTTEDAEDLATRENQ